MAKTSLIVSFTVPSEKFVTKKGALNPLAKNFIARAKKKLKQSGVASLVKTVLAKEI